MKIAIGSDHAGFEMKRALDEYLNGLHHQTVDVGTYDTQAVDYPDIAVKVAAEVTGKRVDKAVLICGSGVGVSVAANKIHGIRAAICHDCYSAHQGVEHDDMNVLVLGARVIGVELAKELVHNYISAQFTHEERHERRLKKVLALEAQ